MLTTSTKRALPFLLLFFSVYAFAQQRGDLGFFQPDERLLIESKWRYTYTLHAESNTIIHKADNQYDYYLYFRYDYTYQEFLNDRLNQGEWGSERQYLELQIQKCGAV